MMIGTAAVLLIIAALVFTLGVRAKDLPPPEPVSPFKHLDERKANIYDNLRDLQFEYRVGKLSEADYKQTKEDLQRELAAVLAEIDAMQGKKPAAAPPHPPPPAVAAAAAAVANQCPHCGARFQKPMKFCGECGKPMLSEVRS